MGNLHSRKMSEVEETLKRISSHKGVIGTVIINNEGVPIRSNLERSEQTAQYASQITDLTRKARSVVRDLDPQNDLTFLRIRSKKHEIMVAPHSDFLFDRHPKSECGRHCRLELLLSSPANDAGFSATRTCVSGVTGCAGRREWCGVSALSSASRAPLRAWHNSKPCVV